MRERKYRQVRQEDILKVRRVVYDLSLPSVPSFLKEITDARLFSVDVCTGFTFEPLHKLHLGILNLFKNCFLSNAVSATLCNKEDWRVRWGRAILSFELRGGSQSIWVCSSTMTVFTECWRGESFGIFIFCFHLFVLLWTTLQDENGIGSWWKWIICTPRWLLKYMESFEMVEWMLMNGWCPSGSTRRSLMKEPSCVRVIF